MTEPQQALIAYRLERADEMLDDARALLKEGRLRSVVNRLYYAVFQAVSALMLKEGIRIKSHSGAKAMFELHFIKTKRIENQWGKFYVNLSDSREESDYGAFVSFSPEDIIPLVPQTEEFIKIVNLLITSEPTQP